MKVDETRDIGGHIVSMDRIMTDLIREARQTFQPDEVAMLNLISQLKMHASMVEHILKVKE